MSITLDLTGNSIKSDNGGFIPAYEYATALLTATSASQTIYVNPSVGGTYVVAGVTATQGTASSSGTLQVEVATGTQAIGSGTNQLTGTVSLAGTANTPVNGTVVASPTVITAGSRVNLILAGTLTSLANCVVSVVLQRVS
jgi:hypothetical protein